MWANSVEARNNGVNTLVFNDGDKYEITNPQFYVSGVTIGKREVSLLGQVTITNTVRE
jgi:hypothetical protein